MGRLRQEDCKFKASLGNFARPDFKKIFLRTGGMVQAVERLPCKL
jgi:hypothetical protein